MMIIRIQHGITKQNKNNIGVVERFAMVNTRRNWNLITRTLRMPYFKINTHTQTDTHICTNTHTHTHIYIYIYIFAQTQ